MPRPGSVDLIDSDAVEAAVLQRSQMKTADQLEQERYQDELMHQIQELLNYHENPTPKLDHPVIRTTSKLKRMSRFVEDMGAL